MLFLLTDSSQKLKLEKTNGTLIILFYVSPSFSSTNNLLFLLKTEKTHSSASDWWEYTNSYFKENPRAFSKNFSTQDYIRISRLRKDYKTSRKKKIPNQLLKTYKMRFIN